MPNKWWQYQRERFPVVAHGALILAFSLSAICFSASLRGIGTDGVSLPSLRAAIVAFITSFLFFLQLRIADEFKDFEEDARFRPYRPVPRGLITLRELKWVFILAGMAQALLALIHNPLLLVYLGITWLYLAGMSKEFFVRDWLKSRPVLYLLSHMAIMPLIDLYVTGCDWGNHQKTPPSGIVWFLVVSYFNGIVIELGRKIRSPEDEEHGVETYSFLWGRKRAVMAWWMAMILTALFAAVAASRLNMIVPIGAVLLLLLVAGIWIGQRFLGDPSPGRGKSIEGYSGAWTVLMYLTLGVLPLVIRILG